MTLRKEKKLRILQVAAVLLAFAFAIGFAACQADPPSGVTPIDPKAEDFAVTNLNKEAGDNAKEATDPFKVGPVTITPQPGKSTGEITIHFEGISPTTLLKTLEEPQVAGTYKVTFDVAKASGYKAAEGLEAGTLIVNNYTPSLSRAALTDFTVTVPGEQKLPIYAQPTILPNDTTLQQTIGTGSTAVQVSKVPITIYYEGVSGTTYLKSANLPSSAGTYKITFDVAWADGKFNANNNLAVTDTLVLTAADTVLPLPTDTVGTRTPVSGEEDSTQTTETGTPTFGNAFYPMTLGLFVGNDTTEVRLNWYSAGATTDKVAQVMIAEKPLATATSYTLVVGGVSTAGSNSAHKATVKSLTAGKTYEYAVSNDGNDWSPTYEYAIPAAGAFSFAVIADPQLTTTASSTSGLTDPNSRYPTATDNSDVTSLPENTALVALATATIGSNTTAAGWLETAKMLAQKGVSFIASGGDQVDASGGNEGEYDYFYAPEEMRKLPLAPVSGNHDNHANFDYHYNLPNRQAFTSETVGTEIARNYFYKYNNILFVVLNTAPYPGTTEAARANVGRFNATLTAAKAKFATYDWLIVQHHKSTASVADHLADTDIQYYVEAGFERLMSEHDVDFVLAGHDHVYARSFPLEGRGGGYVSVPKKDLGSGKDEKGIEHSYTNPGHPIYLTFTTGSGLKYYAVAPDKTFPYGNTVYVPNNVNYPYLGEVTGSQGSELSSQKGAPTYLTGNWLPVSTAAYVQPYIPSYCIAEMSADGKTLKFSTYAIKTKSGLHQTPAGATAAEPYSFDKDEAYDWVSVTKTE